MNTEQTSKNIFMYIKTHYGDHFTLPDDGRSISWNIAHLNILVHDSNNPIFYPFSVKINKCSCNCNNINDPYAKICVLDTVKDLNVTVFNIMSRTNETRHKMAWNW